MSGRPTKGGEVAQRWSVPLGRVERIRKLVRNAETEGIPDVESLGGGSRGNWPCPVVEIGYAHRVGRTEAGRNHGKPTPSGEGFDVLFPQNSLRREYFGLHQDAKSCSRLRGCGDRVHLIAVDYGFAWTSPYI